MPSASFNRSKGQLLFLILTVVCNTATLAQKIERIDLPNKTKSSFYDIFKPTTSDFLVGGKNGYLCFSDTSFLGKYSVPQLYSSQSIYKIDTLNSHTLIFGSDKGSVILYDLKNQQTSYVYVPSLEKQSVYNLSVVDSNRVYICGGHSKIVHGKPAIPRGFVAYSENGGMHWQTIHSKPTKMIWDILYDNNRQQVYISEYSPFSSHIKTIDANGKTTRLLKLKSKPIIHTLYTHNNKLYGTGGYYKPNKKDTGFLFEYDLNTKSLTTYSLNHFAWDIEIKDGLMVVSSSKGYIYYKELASTTFETIQLKDSKNLYELIQAEGVREFYFAGSENRLFKISFE